MKKTTLAVNTRTDVQHSRLAMTRSKILTKWSLKSALIALGLGLTVTVFTITQRTAASGLITEEIPSLLVQTALIEHLPYYTIKRTFIGQVEPSRSTDLGFELAGKITDILFDEGDQVKQGQVLAHLDIERLLARKQELNSALHQAEANQKLAGITYRRYKDVVKFNGVSEQQLDEAREHLRASRAAVSLAESKLSSIEMEIDKSQLIAPFDASITKRMVDEGQILALGHSVFRLLENSTLEIRVAIAGTLVDTIRKGQKYPLIIHHKTIHGSEVSALERPPGFQ
jgi:RND family efflux transporter MFP subunit